MVHVRKVNGEEEIFGNQGALFMNAMTWFDHTTGSVWSQVWGRSIDGPLKGTELELLPSQTIPWGSWKAEHPETLLMINGSGKMRFTGERFFPGYVIGVALDGDAKAYPYEAAAQARVINDSLGEIPLVVVVNPETQAVSVFVRNVDGRDLTLRWADGLLEDEETGSQWDPARGVSFTGPLQGKSLRPIPYTPAFPDSWRDFYPQSEFFE